MILYEEPAEYSPWLRLPFLIPVALFGAAIWLLYNQEYEGFYTLLAESALMALVFYFVMPRKYQIYHDRLRIALGPPVGISLAFSTISEAKHSSGASAYTYGGVRFATSSNYVIQIVRNRGLGYVISPKNGETFLERLNEALAIYRRSHQ
jgi:hypothetical protein